jgi:hypothetical protein
MMPYELVGKVVLGIVAVCLLVVGVVTLYVVWYKFLTLISIIIWRNYDPQEGEYPSQRLRKVSAFAMMLRDNELDKKDEVWETIEDGGW